VQLGRPAWFGSADSPDKWDIIRRLRRCSQMGFKGKESGTYIPGTYSGPSVVSGLSSGLMSGSTMVYRSFFFIHVSKLFIRFFVFGDPSGWGFRLSLCWPILTSIINIKLLPKMKKLLISVSALLFSFVALNAGQCKKDLVDTAVQAGSFKTLAAALQAGDLVHTLKGKGPFTVFAPTDKAFAKLPKGTVENLLKPENKDQLVSILTYHVVPGRLDAKTAMSLKKAKTVNGKKLKVQTKDGSVFLNKSKVVSADVHATNGVIHVIDTVLLPPSKG